MTSNQQLALRTCQCGWSKVTTYHGLRTHQGKAKCGGYGEAVQPLHSSSMFDSTQRHTAHSLISSTSKTHNNQQSLLQPSAGFQSIQETYGILGINIQDGFQLATRKEDAPGLAQWPSDVAKRREDTSLASRAQPLRSGLELKGQIFTEQRPLVCGVTPDHRDELEKLKRENGCLKTRCEEYKTAREKLAMTIKVLERENESLKSRHDILKTSSDKLYMDCETLKRENGNLNKRIEECLAKTDKEKKKVKSGKQAEKPCQSCGHYITRMYSEFLAKRPEQAYQPPCQQCDDHFVQLYQDYLKAKHLESDYMPPCEHCKEEYGSLCQDSCSIRSTGAAALQACQDCGHNFQQLSDILQISQENAKDSTNTSSEDTKDPRLEAYIKKELQQLKRKDLPKAMASVTSQGSSGEGDVLKMKIKWTFDMAKRDMVKKQEELRCIFPADRKDQTSIHLQHAFDKLQKALQNCSQSYFQNSIQEFVKDEPQEVAVVLVKWYRLSCLVALHHPPLQIQWDADGLPIRLDINTATKK